MKINPDLERLAVDVSTLRPEPHNARKHDERSIAAIAASLREFGQQKPIIVVHDGRVIAGNGTLEAAKRLGWTRIAVVRFADEAKAVAYAIADNRSAELSSWDTGVLTELLQQLREKEEIPLDSVGFTDLDLDRMIVGPQEIDPNAEWTGMPEFDQKDKTAARQVVVNFKTNEDALAFGELIGQPFTDKTRSIWYPKAEIERLMDKRYSADEKKAG